MTAFVGPICFKSCTKCGESKPLEGFNRQPAGKYRRKGECKACQATAGQAYVAANPRTKAARGRAWSEANPGKIAAKNKAWREEHRGTMAAYASLRRAGKSRATPLWADHSKIVAIFKAASLQKFTVDHVFPLRGKTVSGLHVEANLQPLCPRANVRKHNKLPGFLAHELWDPKGPDVYHEATQ